MRCHSYVLQNFAVSISGELFHAMHKSDGGSRHQSRSKRSTVISMAQSQSSWSTCVSSWILARMRIAVWLPLLLAASENGTGKCFPERLTVGEIVVCFMCDYYSRARFRFVWLIATMSKAFGLRRCCRFRSSLAPKSQSKRSRRYHSCRSGALVCPECQSRHLTGIDCVALQELIDKLGDKDMDDLIRYIQQCLPGCIVGDDGNDVDVDLGNITLMEQHRLAKHVERIAK